LRGRGVVQKHQAWMSTEDRKLIPNVRDIDRAAIDREGARWTR
jgi:hypothetical protein